MSFDTPIQTIGTIALLMACGYAFLRGGGPERLAAALIFTAWCATPLVQNHDALRHAQYAVFALDGVLTLALLGVALANDRFWPIWVTAFQLLELLMHAAMLIDHGVRPRAYWIGMEIWSYLVLVALLVGTWLEAPRRSRRSSSVSTAS